MVFVFSKCFKKTTLKFVSLLFSVPWLGRSFVELI